VVIYGEPGSGKDRVLRTLADADPSEEEYSETGAAMSGSCLEELLCGLAKTKRKRDGKPGLIEKAEGASIIVRDLESWPLDAQAVLQRLLKPEAEFTRVGGAVRRRVRCRFIAIMTENPRVLIQKRMLAAAWADMFPVIISVPTLNERRSDIPQLVDRICQAYGEKHNIDAQVSRLRPPRRVVEEWTRRDWSSSSGQAANVRSLEMETLRHIRGELPKLMRSANDKRLRARLKAVMEAEQVPSDDHGNVFRYDGKTWEISFQGITAEFRNLRGIRFMAALIDHPNEPTRPDLLYAGYGVKGNRRYWMVDGMRGERLTAGPVSASRDSDEENKGGEAEVHEPAMGSALVSSTDEDLAQAGDVMRVPSTRKLSTLRRELARIRARAAELKGKSDAETVRLMAALREKEVSVTSVPSLKCTYITPFFSAAAFAALARRIFSRMACPSLCQRYGRGARFRSAK
jgi:hypothetical protein